MFLFNSTLDMFLVGVLVLVFIALAVILWRLRSVKPFNYQPPPLQGSGRDSGIPASGGAPSYSDLAPGGFNQGSFSSQLQTETYNLRVEDIGGQRRFVLNGVAYPHLENIPERGMRRLARKMVVRDFQSGYARGAQNETIRQVQTGNQATIEVKSPDYRLSIQRQGRHTRYIVNGMTYYRLGQIPDPQMRSKARQLLGQML